MKDKLTLSIDKNVKEHAKKVAFKKGESISKMVEDYLRTLSGPSVNQKIESDSIVSELSGSVSIPADADYRKSLTDIIEENYDGKKNSD
jgi:hypothetical protein